MFKCYNIWWIFKVVLLEVLNLCFDLHEIILVVLLEFNGGPIKEPQFIVDLLLGTVMLNGRFIEENVLEYCQGSTDIKNR